MQTPLRKIRKDEGLTLLSVALATKIDVGNLSRIERGRQRTSFENAEVLSRFFHRKISEIQILYPYQLTHDNHK